MLGMETPRAYMHTFKVAIIDPSTDAQGWSFDRFYAEAARRIHLLPMLRWKCVESPLGLNHPIGWKIRTSSCTTTFTASRARRRRPQEPLCGHDNDLFGATRA